MPIPREVVLGTVRGYRWWRFTPGPWLLSPWRGDVRWEPGENTASCLGKRRLIGWAEGKVAHPRGAPEAGCACGFYGMLDVPGSGDAATSQWPIDPAMSAGPLPLVFGVAEAYGRVLIGRQGWRAERAKVLALFAPRESALGRLVEDSARTYEVPLVRNLDVLREEWGPDDGLRELSVPAA